MRACFGLVVARNTVDFVQLRESVLSVASARGGARYDASEQWPACEVCTKPCTVEEEMRCHKCGLYPIHVSCWWRHAVVCMHAEDNMLR